jgi:hypothetical protein
MAAAASASSTPPLGRRIDINHFVITPLIALRRAVFNKNVERDVQF